MSWDGGITSTLAPHCPHHEADSDFNGEPHSTQNFATVVFPLDEQVEIPQAVERQLPLALGWSTRLHTHKDAACSSSPCRVGCANGTDSL